VIYCNDACLRIVTKSQYVTAPPYSIFNAGYLVKRVGIWREVGDEGVPGLVVGSDLQVLLLANLHQPPDRYLYQFTTYTLSLPVLRIRITFMRIRILIFI
jgi:hypothetical protein